MFPYIQIIVNAMYLLYGGNDKYNNKLLIYDKPTKFAPIRYFGLTRNQRDESASQLDWARYEQ